MIVDEVKVALDVANYEEFKKRLGVIQRLLKLIDGIEIDIKTADKKGNQVQKEQDIYQSKQEFIYVLSGFVKDTLSNPKEATPEQLRCATDIAKLLVERIV